MFEYCTAWLLNAWPSPTRQRLSGQFLLPKSVDYSRVEREVCVWGGAILDSHLFRAKLLDLCSESFLQHAALGFSATAPIPCAHLLLATHAPVSSLLCILPAAHYRHQSPADKRHNFSFHILVVQKGKGHPQLQGCDLMAPLSRSFLTHSPFAQNTQVWESILVCPGLPWILFPCS